MIIDYSPEHARGWLRCRVLAFLDTAYYDDVYRAVPTFDNPAIRLLEVANDTVRGLIDVELFADGTATIDTIAVLPEHARLGIGTALLAGAVDRLPIGTRTLDAWTRDDAASNAWYRRNGFAEEYRYLHVHVSDGDPIDGFVTPEPLSPPVQGFYHAPIEYERELRARFRRVHQCRQYLRAL